MNCSCITGRMARASFFTTVAMQFRVQTALPESSYQSAERTNDSGPAVYCWEKSLKNVESVKRTAEGRYRAASCSERDKDSTSKLIIFKSISRELSSYSARYCSRFCTDPQPFAALTSSRTLAIPTMNRYDRVAARPVRVKRPQPCGRNAGILPALFGWFVRARCRRFDAKP